LTEADDGDSPSNLLAGPAMVGAGLGEQVALGRVVEAVELLDLAHGQMGEESGGQVAGDDVGGDAATDQALAEAVLKELVVVGVDEGAETDGLGCVAAGVGGGVAGEQIVEEGLADGDAEGEQVLAGDALDLGQGGRELAGGERGLGYRGLRSVYASVADGVGEWRGLGCEVVVYGWMVIAGRTKATRSQMGLGGRWGRKERRGSCAGGAR
jgi:hypothetical protein